MDAKERIVGRGEHRISVVDSPDGSGERAGTRIHEEEEVTSPAIEPSVKYWINGEVQDAGTDEEVASPATEPSVKRWIRESLDAGIFDEEVASPAVEPGASRWVGEVQEKIRCAVAASPSPSSNSYFRERPEICKSLLDEEFCRPRAVTVGPYHRHESTSITDADKWLIVCLMNNLYGIDLAGCLAKMKNQAAAALACYSFSDMFESFDVVEDDKAFAEMLLLDSYFILFMLTAGDFVLLSCEIHSSRLTLTESNSPTPSIGNSPSPLIMPRVREIMLKRDKIMLDLLIVDNQIPFFVIEELFKELKLEKQRPLHKYALDFFEIIHPRSTQGRRESRNDPPRFFHLLDLFHWSRVPEKKYDVVSSSHHQLDSIYRARYTPTAMELRESATMIKKKTSGSPLDITFRRGRLVSVVGVLHIPNLHIHACSSFVFHNLIAFEMQCRVRGRCTMAFSAFMRNLLQSEEDVKLLRQRGILANTSMTDSNLVDFFKRLSRLTENYQMPSDLYAIYKQVLSHHNRRMSRFYGSIILQYFPNPLVTLSVFAAAVLFVLTFLQTIYTILSYYKR